MKPRRPAPSCSSAYPVVHDEERQFGILRFLEVAPRFDALASSQYRAIAASYAGGDRGVYPGSALLAMTMLGNASSYLLCDLDQESVTDLRRWSRELGLRRCEVPPHPAVTPDAAAMRNTGRVHLSLVTLVVTDYDAAISFFVTALGFELAEDSAARTK